MRAYRPIMKAVLQLAKSGHIMWEQPCPSNTKFPKYFAAFVCLIVFFITSYRNLDGRSALAMLTSLDQKTALSRIVCNVTITTLRTHLCVCLGRPFMRPE